MNLFRENIQISLKIDSPEIEQPKIEHANK